MILDQELETFQRELPRLLQEHEGEYVLIHADQVDSFWKTEDEADEAGCDRFGLELFLIKKVQKEEPVLNLFVNVIPRCRSGLD
jgi:hypothetical protein